MSPLGRATVKDDTGRRVIFAHDTLGIALALLIPRRSIGRSDADAL